MTSARLPTPEGEFRLALYRSDDGKDHLALVLGDVAGKSGVVARIHSECFTGDVLGSLRCDCGAQLERALQMIAAEGRGILIYLRQEGRGIGLLQKLRAYNLQDAGYDTVEANLELGHQADERDYGAAVAILRDQGVESVRLLTNNPTKLEGLVEHGFSEVERIPLETPATPENAGYLETKVRRMRHLLDLDSLVGDRSDATAETLVPAAKVEGRPSVTLTWAQSLDGSITFRRGKAMALSCPEALELTHGLRARHDGILVGIGTVLADDPRLTVRLVEGHDPQPIVLDGELRLPPEAELLRSPKKTPWVITTDAADPERQLRLEEAGARVIRLPADERSLVDLHELLARLDELGIRSLMVEGGSQVITSFLRERLVDRLVLTIAPLLVGGLGAVGRLETDEFPELVHTRYRWVGSNLVLTGEVRRHHEEEIDDELLKLGGAL